MKKLVVARRISQGIFLTLFVYILWSTTWPLTSILPPDLFFKADPLLIIVTSISERIILPGLLVAGAMLVLTLIVGRFFCGWVCPLGTAIDMAGSLRRKRQALSDGVNRGMRSVKFLFLGAIGIAALFGRQVAWVLDPMVIVARFVSLNLIPAVTAALNNTFIFLIRDLHIEALRGVYRALKPTVLGIQVHFFPHTFLILAYFLAVVLAGLFVSRLWCRMLCPLGALYALAARFAPLKRIVDECVRCSRCRNDCRIGAIRKDLTYSQGECILCMDCVYDCPSHGTRFGFSGARVKAPENSDQAGGITRRQFMVLAGTSLALLGGKKAAARTVAGADRDAGVIRPPAALEEEDFTDRCVRCGNCIKVCITNGLQPVSWQAGIEGIWTPQLVPEIGYCEYNCTLCGNTCPTGAIPKLSLEEKQRTKLGTARIDHSLCIPWAQGKECIVCEEHCPVADKAIRTRRDPVTGVLKPYVDEKLCVGCGICQNKCPVRPVRAIRVTPEGAARTRAT